MRSKLACCSVECENSENGSESLLYTMLGIDVTHGIGMSCLELRCHGISAWNMDSLSKQVFNFVCMFVQEHEISLKL